MKSLAIWYSGIQRENTTLDIHINFWKLPSQTVSFFRFLDIGLNLHNASKIDKLLLYLPFAVKSENLTDLGRVISFGSGSLLTAIFNEDYQITSAAKSDYHEVKDSTGNEVFNIYELSQSNFSVISKYEGTLISITLPKESVRKERTYLRFRISGSDLLSFSRIEKNVSSVFGSAFTKTEILDFRINSTRHLPNKLLEEINQARMFNILKIHFFYICSYRENYVLSHQPFSGARRLEDDIWTEYISATPGNSFDSNQETLIAYHWKEKANASNIIDDFSVLMKTSFRHNDWTTIIKYIIFLLIFSIVTGLIANFLFSHLTDYSKNKDTPSITTPANNNNEIVDKTKLDSPPNQVEVEEQNNKQR